MAALYLVYGGALRDGSGRELPARVVLDPVSGRVAGVAVVATPGLGAGLRALVFRGVARSQGAYRRGQLSTLLDLSIVGRRSFAEGKGTITITPTNAAVIARWSGAATGELLGDLCYLGTVDPADRILLTSPIEPAEVFTVWRDALSIARTLAADVQRDAMPFAGGFNTLLPDSAALARLSLNRWKCAPSQTETAQGEAADLVGVLKVAALLGGLVYDSRGSLVGVMRMAIASGGGVAGWLALGGSSPLVAGFKGRRASPTLIQIQGEGVQGSGIGPFDATWSLDTAASSVNLPLRLSSGRFAARLSLLGSIPESSAIDASRVFEQNTNAEADRALVWIAGSQWGASSVAQRAAAWVRGPYRNALPSGEVRPLDPVPQPDPGEVDPALPGELDDRAQSGEGVTPDEVVRLREYLESIYPHLRTAAQWGKWFLVAAGVLILARLGRRAVMG